MMERPPEPTGQTLGEIVHALKAKAGFDVLYPEEAPVRKKAIEFVARLTGKLPDAYDVLAAGAYLETLRVVKARADAALKGDGQEPERFDWDNVSRHDVLRALEGLTVSMGSGKGRKEGVDIAKTAGPPMQRSRWSWGRREE